VLVYTTISGAVGALIPFISGDDVEFMTTLEMVSLNTFPLHQVLMGLAYERSKYIISRKRSPSI
jgi:hypothetical protein